MKGFGHIFVFIAIVLIGASTFSLSSQAQTSAVTDSETDQQATESQGEVQQAAGDGEGDISDVQSEEAVGPSDKVQSMFEERKPVFNPKEYASLVFTYWEQDAIKLARRASNGEGTTGGVTEEELKNSQVRREDIPKPPPEEREIRLSGILYNGNDSWTIWLNEKRVTPKAVPNEVIDLKVRKEYIEFKWFDNYTNRIYPIRLRPHQRFNIDTRIFLPG